MFRMSGQKSILSFFNRDLVKRNPLQDANCSAKRFKSSIDDSISSDKDQNAKEIDRAQNDKYSDSLSDASPKNINTNDQNTSDNLTVSEKSQIEKKRLLAKQKLLCKRFPILDPNMCVSWFAAMESEFTKPYFEKLNEFITLERKSKVIYPPADKVWTWTKYCELDDIKVVIIGQDPYINCGQAHGLCFSVPVGVQRPPSLVNIFKELSKSCDKFEIPEHGYLIGWAKQGVLLLNTVLTVEAKKSNSHKDCGWEKLTTAVIKYISDKLDGVVFLLWGNQAQKIIQYVDRKRHHVLKAGHPSPLSVRFFSGCNHFVQCNEILQKQNKVSINWNHLPEDLKSE